MDILSRNLFHRYGHPCVDGRECRLIRRSNAILLYPRQGTRISFKDFYKPIIPSTTIPTKVASLSTSNSAGIATNRRGAGIASKSEDGLESRRNELYYFLNLIETSWRSQDYSECIHLLKCMVSAGHAPNVSLSIKLINAFSSPTFSSGYEISQAEEVMEILEKHGSQDIDAYNSLLTLICKKTIPSTAKHVMKSCIAVLDRMQAHGCFPDLETYNIIISALCDKGRLDLAMELLDQMIQENQFQPSFITYTILIEASFRGTYDYSENGEDGVGITGVIVLLDEMAAKGLQLDNDTYNCILREMFHHGLVDQAWQLMRTLGSSHQTSGTSSSSSGFKPILAPGVISYNILLTGLLSMRRWQEAEKLVLEMVSTEQCGTNETCHSILINSFCEQGMVDKAIKVLDDMMARGLKPDTYICDSIVSTYCKQGRMNLAITFMEHLLSHGYVPDNVNYDTFLSSLCKSGTAYPSLEVLDRLEKMGCHPNTTSSYNAFIGGFWFYGDRTKAVKMLSQMVDKGIHPDEVTYNTLISCLCKDGMVYHAIQLMADMEATWGYMPTVITYNNIILGLCKAHHIDAAIDIFEEMMERRCTPNESTYIMLVEGLAHAGHVEEARKVSTALLSCNAISSDRIRRLKKTYSMQPPTWKQRKYTSL